MQLAKHGIWGKRVYIYVYVGICEHVKHDQAVLIGEIIS